MTIHHHNSDSRLRAAYPGLLPGFFTPLVQPIEPVPRFQRARGPYVDPASHIPPRRRKAMEQALGLAALRTLSILLEHADVIHHGNSVILTCALSPDELDMLCIFGTEFEDAEMDDPMEEDDFNEDEGLDEDVEGANFLNRVGEFAA